MTRWAMAVDAAHCVGCQTCVVACQMHSALRPGVAWLRVDALEFGRWPDADLLFLPHACLHCDDAPCVGVCPTGASFQRADGVVLVDYETCIGCGVCLTACPYGARTINTDERWFFDAAEAAPYEDAPSGRVGVAEKCTLCADRIDRGQAPACVEACPVGVRAFGDLDDAQGNLSAFVEETGARLVAGTGALYADGGRALDSGSLIAERWYAPSGDNVAAREEASLDVDPAFLAGAAVVAAGAVAGIGIGAKRSRERRLHLLDVGADPEPDGDRGGEAGSKGGSEQSGADVDGGTEGDGR